MSKKNRQENSSAKPSQAPQSRFGDYLWANGIFFGFLVLLAWVVWVSCQAPTDDAQIQAVMGETFKFLIVLFGAGFLVVTLFDAAFDFFEEKAAGNETSNGQGA